MTHDLAEWKDEIAWMSLYFSVAVWASLGLCVFYSLRIISRAIVLNTRITAHIRH